MKHFKSFKNLKAASLEDIKAAKVIPEEVAEEPGARSRAV